jgi:glycogen(starch) synthase
MRLLVWCSRFWPHRGGIQILGLHLLSALQARGYDLCVITQRDNPEQPEEESVAGIPVSRFPFWQALEQRDGARIHALRRQILDLKATFCPHAVYMYHLGPEAFFELQTRGALPLPLVCSLHSQYSAEAFRPGSLLHRLLHAAARITAPSTAILEEIRQALPDRAPATLLIPNAVAQPQIEPAPLPFAPPRLLCLGRLIEEKGFDLALTAFATICTRWPTARLLIAGDGPARATLERQAASLGIAGAVEFAGWVAPEAIPALLNGVTLVLMPSRTEGLPLVAVQTAQAGRPLVASRAGGLPEVVRDGETGILVEIDNAAALALAVLSLLDAPERAVRMGQAARTHVAERFNWERCVAAYDGLFTDLVDPSPTVLDRGTHGVR